MNRYDREGDPFFVDAGAFRDRSLLELVDRDRQSPPLTRREKRRLIQGYAVAIVAVLLLVAVLGLAGASDLVR
jgi:hypothetical protein